MPKFAYIEQCRDLHRQIGEGEFIKDIQEPSGRGSDFIFNSYGRVALKSGETIYIGQKTPRPDRGDSLMRLVSDLQTCSILVDRCPELLPKLPLFVGLGGQGENTYIVTEDASKAGQYEVLPRSTSDETCAMLAEGFKDFGKFDSVFENETLSRSLAFTVGDQERLLDITPSPYTCGFVAIMDAYRDSGLSRLALKTARELQFYI